jgi:hypothetical protein
MPKTINVTYLGNSPLTIEIPKEKDGKPLPKYREDAGHNSIINPDSFETLTFPGQDPSIVRRVMLVPVPVDADLWERAKRHCETVKDGLKPDDRARGHLQLFIEQV